MIFMFGNDVTVMVNLFELAAVDTPYAVSFQKYEGKRYCISESLSINNAAAGGDWIRNEADASNAHASSHWCGCGCNTGLGLGRHRQRGARQRVQKDTGKARKRVYPYPGIDNSRLRCVSVIDGQQ